MQSLTIQEQEIKRKLQKWEKHVGRLAEGSKKSYEDEVLNMIFF